MSPATSNRPRVGIPWRTSEEEAGAAKPELRAKIHNYEEAIRKAGGEPVLLSLARLQESKSALASLDAFVLPGSPADVEPSEYGARNTGLSAAADLPREAVDRAILDHAFSEKKPVLAICYGCQLLNVYLGGTLIQDLRAETGTAMPHRKKDVVPESQEDPIHGATFASGSRLQEIAAGAQAPINSSHHQAIAKPGKNLSVTAHATDGTIEAIEWTGDQNWIVGVQWHPERMFGDAFSERLFQQFISAARTARGLATQKVCLHP